MGDVEMMQHISMHYRISFGCDTQGEGRHPPMRLAKAASSYYHNKSNDITACSQVKTADHSTINHRAR